MGGELRCNYMPVELLTCVRHSVLTLGPERALLTNELIATLGGGGPGTPKEYLLAKCNHPQTGSLRTYQAL